MARDGGKKEKRTRENTVFLSRDLAAQCEIPPHIAQYPFEILSQRGVSRPLPCFHEGIARVSLRYPF